VFRTHTLTTQSQSAGSRRRSKQFSLFFCVSTVRSNASPQQENLHFYSVLLSSCEFSKSAFGIYCIFPVFYHLFKEKFDIFVTVKSDSAIFWASTEKAKFFVRIPSLYFYSGRLRRYSVWSLHCSSLASKDSVFKAQLSIAVTRLTAKCFISKFAASQFVTRSSSVPSFISLPTSPIEILSFKSKSQSQGLARGWFIGPACPDPTSLPPAAFLLVSKASFVLPF